MDAHGGVSKHDQRYDLCDYDHTFCNLGDPAT